ncbi:MAG TPA: SigE family RNA polymerase sigma factor [Actinopolymorphaceae bacterium]|jgi:RNA polymerase sigma-70 factor (sigma-E family)
MDRSARRRAEPGRTDCCRTEPCAAEQFSAYVTAHQPALLRWAYILTGDHHTAEDLVQSALVRTYVAWDRIRDKRSLDAYVRRVIVNLHATWLRQPWRLRERTTDVVPEPRSPSQATRIEEHNDLWRLVSGLPPRQRATVVLRYYEDLTEVETARVLGCAVGTVKRQASRALATLRARLSSLSEP